MLEDPNIIIKITSALHNASPRLQSLICEILAGYCILSPKEGYQSVIDAFSDYRAMHGEQFRFQELIQTLKANGSIFPQQPDYLEEENYWEVRTSIVTLVNALTGCPNLIEDRIILREELSRRGLDEALLVCWPSLSVVIPLIPP